ncbi:MAG TPA: hypothetical protein VN880_09065, partial [Solirubrobacteraceae bacterium]|nr:hypothetical protein [Solirubrobacteraceae bacterium]
MPESTGSAGADAGAPSEPERTAREPPSPEPPSPEPADSEPPSPEPPDQEPRDAEPRDAEPPDPESPPHVPLATVAREWTRIGLTGFGGPPAHISL